MRVAVFSSKPYDRDSLISANAVHGHDLEFFDNALDSRSCGLVQGFEAVCVFVNDQVGAELLRCLARQGVRVVALRCAGFNNVDVAAARALGIQVVRVPVYSPNAVAEHTVALVLSLNRHIHRAYNRVREGNFSLNGLLGFDMKGKTAGIVGTGRIGTVLARILHGFGCELLGNDVRESPECLDLGMRYVPRDTLLAESDIISLHCPLTPETRHLIDLHSIPRMKRGVMLINTGRGALVDTAAVIAGLKGGHIGALGLDVYEQEENVFFEDHSEEIIQDDLLMRLMTFPNVLITSHQGFFTREAITAIAESTLENLSQIGRGEVCPNAL